MISKPAIAPAIPATPTSGKKVMTHQLNMNVSVEARIRQLAVLAALRDFFAINIYLLPY